MSRKELNVELALLAAKKGALFPQATLVSCFSEGPALRKKCTEA